MQINCQRRVATATAPSSGIASLTICVSFMILVSATALVAIPLLSLLVTGHGILAIGMSIMLPLLFDHHYSPLPRFGSEVEPSLCSYCLVSSIVLAKAATYLPSPIVERRLLYLGSYCLVLLIVLRPSEDQTTITIVQGYYTA